MEYCTLCTHVHVELAPFFVIDIPMQSAACKGVSQLKNITFMGTFVTSGYGKVRERERKTYKYTCTHTHTHTHTHITTPHAMMACNTCQAYSDMLG